MPKLSQGVNAKSQDGSAKSQVTRVNLQSVSVTFAIVESETVIGVCEFAVGVCESRMEGQRGDQHQKSRLRITLGESREKWVVSVGSDSDWVYRPGNLSSQHQSSRMEGGEEM